MQFPTLAGNVDNMKSWGIKIAIISGRNRSLDDSWEVTYTATLPIFYIMCYQTVFINQIQFHHENKSNSHGMG